MRTIQRTARMGAAVLMFAGVGACSSVGGLGNVLGSVLGGSNQVSGSVQGVNTRYSQISIQQSNGQTVNLTYDNQTQVVYQNRNYPVTSLEYGDQVTARITNSGNNGNYTDLIQVDQSVSGTTGGTSNTQSIEGNVRQVDQTNGWFTVSASNRGTVTVTMPYNPRRSDLNRFQTLRAGDYVRLYGVILNNSRVELQQFY